jgi:hypothetical protein
MPKTGLYLIETLPYPYGVVKFFNPYEFRSTIKTTVSEPLRHQEDVFSLLVPHWEATLGGFYEEEGFPQHPSIEKISKTAKDSKGLPDLHAFHLLMDMFGKKIVSRDLFDEKIQTYLSSMVEEFLNPVYAIRLSEKEFFIYDPQEFIYAVTPDNTKGQLFYLGKKKCLSTITVENTSTLNKSTGTT